MSPALELYLMISPPKQDLNLAGYMCMIVIGQIIMLVGMHLLIGSMHMEMCVYMSVLMGMNQIPMAMFMRVRVAVLMGVLQGNGVLDHENRSD